MSFYDDVLYLSLLVASIVVGRFVRPGPNTVEVSKWISSLMGVTIVFLVSGIHGLHCVAAFAIQIATMSAVRGGRLHAVSFVLQFSYLIFFRLCAYVGLPSPPPHTNAIMMIMTLKLIGVALEMQETRGYEDNDDDDEEVKLRKKYKGVAPSPLDIFHYVFSHAGVLTGGFRNAATCNMQHANC
jgi:lysophospholipid acyltransferase 7